MICKKCGAECEDGRIFCQACGLPLHDEEENQNTNNPVNSAPSQPVTSQTDDMSSPILNGTSDYSNVPDSDDAMGLNSGYEMPKTVQGVKKKSKAKKIVIIIVTIILVFLIIFGLVFGLVFSKIYKMNKTLASTWENFAAADSQKICDQLPEEFLNQMNITYGFSESDVKSAIEMLIGDLSSTNFDSSAEIKIKSMQLETVKKDDAKSEIADAVNSLFDDQLASYSSQFESVFPGSYKAVEAADKVYEIEEEVSDGTTTEEYDTIIFKIDDTSYDIYPLLIADICCYYYSIYNLYMNDYAEETTVSSESVSETVE